MASQDDQEFLEQFLGKVAAPIEVEHASGGNAAQAGRVGKGKGVGKGKEDQDINFESSSSNDEDVEVWFEVFGGPGKGDGKFVVNIRPAGRRSVFFRPGFASTSNSSFVIASSS